MIYYRAATKKKGKKNKSLRESAVLWENESTNGSLAYPTPERKAVVELQQRLGQFRSNHMLQVDLVALKHSIGVLGAPPDINPVYMEKKD